MTPDEWCGLEDVVLAEMGALKPWYHRLVTWLAWVDSILVRWLAR